MNVLNLLEQTDWASLKHAYGSAADVPDQIRCLTSGDKETRDKALWQLYGNIFHQGTRYQASSYAVPCLYGLLLDPSTPARDEIVELLVAVAIGYTEYYIPDGFPVEDFRRKIEYCKQNLTDEEREDAEEFGVGPEVELNCYDAVARQLPLLVELTKSELPELRRAAIYALAWFPEFKAQSIRAALEVLDMHSEVLDIVHCLLTLALLTKSGGTTVENIASFLNHSSIAVRGAAAIALAQNPQQAEIIDVLLQTTISADAIEKDFKDGKLLFNEGDLPTYSGQVLLHAHPSNYPRIVQAMEDVLKQLKNPLSALNTVSTMLTMLLVENGQIIHKTANDLEDWQRQALETIAEYGPWKIRGLINANFSVLINRFGLPGSQMDLLAYLETR